MKQQQLPPHLTDFYHNIKILPSGKYVAINRLLFTCAIIRGDIDDTHGYDERWCYNSYGDAKKALDNWDGNGDPDGWHRHPKSGRRRDGNGREWIAV